MDNFVRKTAKKSDAILAKNKNVSKKSGYPLYCANPTIFSVFMSGIGKYERIIRKLAINKPLEKLNIPKNDRKIYMSQKSFFDCRIG